MTTNLFNQQRNTRPSIVVIGGGYAGMISALRLARGTHGHADVHLVNPQARFVERIRLHEIASGRNLRTIEIPALLRGRGVNFHQTRATQIDWRSRQVTLSNGSVLEYDRLVYALGSQIDRTTPGVRDHALALEDIQASAQISHRLNQLAVGSEVVVVGGGLTGTELVFELADRYPQLRWTMVAREAYQQGYAPAARDYFLSQLARRGITLRTGINVQLVEADHLVTNEGDLSFALCLWAGSFRGLPLGRESGLAVNERDQVLVDATLRSLTAPEIYVVGDSAALPASYQPFLVMGCKTAMPLGVHAAENLLGELRGETPQPMRYTYMVTCVSLGRRDGLIQFLTPEGEPVPRFVTGKLGAWVKELICLSTVISLQAERHFSFYDWFLPARKQAESVPIHEPSPAQGQRI
jgi:NADH:ubiquinone reductase (H+-translocating)